MAIISPPTLFDTITGLIADLLFNLSNGSYNVKTKGSNSHSGRNSRNNGGDVNKGGSGQGYTDTPVFFYNGKEFSSKFAPTEYQLIRRRVTNQMNPFFIHWSQVSYYSSRDSTSKHNAYHQH
jgi:hypothetical protein